MRQRKSAVVLGIVVLALSGGWFLLGFRCVDFGDVPAEFHAEDQLDALLEVALRDGGVDYAAVRAFEQGSGANELAASYGQSGPTERSARLAYAINAYNATVLALVARNRPEDSIHEVRGLIEPQAGFGFFYAQRFDFDGAGTNLYDLENDVIRSFGDARIHAAINCASASCPSLYERAFRPELLDEQLDEVARRFVSDPRHVRYEGETLYLSAIFDWFSADFAAHRLPNGEEGLHAFLRAFCENPSCEAPIDAEIRFNDYDWSLNGAGD